MKIFTVVGETNEYDSSSWHIVCAYYTERAAIKRVTELNTTMREVGAMPNLNFRLRQEAIGRMREHPNGDADFHLDYSGATYEIIETELI